ncbi:MAG: Calx-beta domain-containing protein [Chloroflexota bacterium]
MTRRHTRLLIRLLVLATLILPLDALHAGRVPVAFADPSAFTVTNVDDSGPGSLRQAILDANAHPNAIGPRGTIVDAIDFAIPAAQCSPVTHACTISPLSALPAITEAVTLDGWSQGGPGFSGPPLVELNGTNAGDGVSGLTVAGRSVKVQGFAVNSFRGHGIVVRGAGAIIYGNYIGTDPTGRLKRPNQFSGIDLDGASPARIGEQGANGNVISGNTVGILIEHGADTLTIGGNMIGTDPLGSVPLGNASSGILVLNGSISYIGSNPHIAPGLSYPNVIAYNGGTGVTIASGSANWITGNLVFGNAGLGIDLGGDGVTANDPFDVDDGPNHLVNFPLLTSARPTGSSTTIAGRLETEPWRSGYVDLFESPACSPDGRGQGDRYLTTIQLRTDAQGNAVFQATVPGLSIGHGITATAAIFSGDDLVASTSEFSACRAVATPSITVTPANPLVTTEAGGAATATVVLTEQPTTPVTIPLSSSNTREGTVSPASLTFTSANWAVPQTVTITGVDDAVADGDLSYQVAIGQASSTDTGYDGLNPNDLQVVNRDDEGTPAFSIADVRIAEGNAGATTTSFTVTLAPASTGIVSVRYATSDGSATAPSDYTATSGLLSFEPGETSKTIAVPIVGDTTVEPDETFAVVLSSPVNATIARAQAQGTITNDDTAPTPQPCAPRPAPRIQTSQLGAGRLQVTVAAQTTAALPSNALQRLDFGAAENAHVEIPGAAPGSPGGPSSTPGGPAGTPGSFSLPLPPGTTSATFVAQRQRPGPFRVAYTVVDTCQSAGAFTTFVGGGTGVQ